MHWLRRNTVWLVLVASLAFNAGVGATFGVRTYRHYCDGAERAAKRPRAEKFYEGLNLSAEQRAHIDASRKAMMERIGDLHRAYRARNEELAELIAAPETDPAEVQTRLDAMADMRGQIQRQIVDHYLQIKQVLGPEQQAGFDEMVRRGLLHERRGPGGKPSGARWRRPGPDGGAGGPDAGPGGPAPPEVAAPPHSQTPRGM